MATIGVLTYTLPHGLKLKNSLEKFTTISNNNNIIKNIDNNNSIGFGIATGGLTKIESVGMIGNEVFVMRKKQKLVPLSESTTINEQQEVLSAGNQPPSKKQKLSDNVQRASVQFSSPQHAKITSQNVHSAKKIAAPQPQAVARRNARERNRVKQVNNGFAALRQHIPEEVAVAFEASGNGRGNNKKLSKVETLRMAVEYIRSLERLLEIDTTNRPDAPDFDLSGEINPVIKTESCSSSMDDQYSESNYDPDETSAIYYADTLPDMTTVHGQQYLRIPGTNTYQLITSDMYCTENDENIHPSNTEYSLSSPAVHSTSSILVDPQSFMQQGNFMETNELVVSSTAVAPVSLISPPTSSLSSSSMMVTSGGGGGCDGQGQQPLSNLSPANSAGREAIASSIDRTINSTATQILNDQQQELLAHLYHMQDHQKNIRIKSEELSLSATTANVYPLARESCNQQIARLASPTAFIANELNAGNHFLGSGAGGFFDAQFYNGVITLRRKIKQEELDDGGGIEMENVILETTAGTGLSEDILIDTAIDWWQPNTSPLQQNDDPLNQ